METSEGRHEAVLAAVVRAYVDSAHPVASGPVAEELDLSSATIRNVFADLERHGYLSHPHTSSGRMPTDKGYRLYVDRLMRVRELNLKERQAIEEEYHARRGEVEALLRHSAGLLSAMTRLAGVAVTPVSDAFQLERFQLAVVDSRRVLVILVTSDGLVREEVVRLEDPLSVKEVEKVLHILNQKFAGLALNDIRTALLREADESRRLRLALVQAALDLIDHALRVTPENVVLEGASRLIEQPEFRDPGHAGRVLRLVEERQPLARLLAGQWASPGLKVQIGREIPESLLNDFSVVHVPYRIGGRVAGALAVLGPTRMAYDQVSPLLEMVARLVEERLNGERE